MEPEQMEFEVGSAASLDSTSLKHDATPSFRGAVYQIGVAVLRCFELAEGQTLYFEKFGDISVLGCAQTEVKHYDKPLSDLSLNFWKTLSNWMQDGFNPVDYASLVLYTSQTFGKTARIATWNSFEVSQKVAMIQEISSEILAKESARRQGKPRAKPLELAVIVQNIMAPQNEEKLLQILGRFFIESDSPKLPDLHKHIKEVHLKGSMGTKRDDFLDALFGFIIRPEKIAGVWSISYDEFTKKVQELTALYCVSTVFFPRRYIQTQILNPVDPLVAKHKDHRFVDKILEIEHGERVPEAVRDYLSAVNTIRKEFRDYAISNTRTEDYSNSLRSNFSKRHRNASLKMCDSIRDSQIFYDEFTSEAPLPFEGFNTTPVEFRNGLLHIQLDDSSQNLQWKVNTL